MSSFQFQVTNFISAMAGAIASDAVATPGHPEVEDFSPTTAQRHQCRILELRNVQDLESVEYLSTWLPSVQTLVAKLDLTTDKHSTRISSEHSLIRDFGNFVAKLESPSASAFESYDLLQIRISLSERSLTYADFRHAVDHHVDYASSTWQNN